MVMMAGSRLTVEAFYQRRDEWPEGGRWCELVDGEVFELSPPDVMHSGVVLNLASKLGVYAQETQNGYACFDIGFVVARCPDTVRMINIAYFTAGSRFGLFDVGYSEQPPVLAVELASSRDRQETMSQRVDEFLRGGVPLVWVLDTVDRCVEINRKDTVLQKCSAGDILGGDDILPDFECEVGPLFDVPQW
tara:strand:- start:1609 stop:2181 length:573 start_codon:yes stop_codon:yes gene_type:complete